MIQSSTTYTTFSTSAKTGTICQRTGPYKNNTSPVVTIMMKKGAKFPTDTKGKICTWTIVK
jgi:hypothetical protein